jgi:hypothetical protein
MVSIGLNGPYLVVEKYQVIILIHVFLNLVEIRGIKYTCKVASLNCHSRENEDDNEQ